MCGRYFYDQDHPLLASFFEKVKENHPHHHLQNSTILPGGETLVLGQNYKGKIKASSMKWGFQAHNKLIVNARSETILERPLFREDFLHFRLVYPMTAFYEFDSHHHPHLFFEENHQPLFVAGFYHFRQKNYESILLTQQANSDTSYVHHRMPVIIHPEEVRSYLTDPDFAQHYISVDHSPQLIEDEIPNDSLSLF